MANQRGNNQNQQSQILTRIEKLDKEVFFLTNCDSRLLKVKSSQVPLLNFADSWISSVDIGVVKEDQKFWKIALEKLNILSFGSHVSPIRLTVM